MRFFRKLFHPILRHVHAWYLSKPRKYTYKNLSVWVQPGVFPPFMTVSTKVLLDFFSSKDLTNKRVLELGCGSGIVSVLAASRGAIVTATDINETALKALAENLEHNNVKIEILYSDLFDNISEHRFDVMIINPPYYARAPKSVAEQAWFCGEAFEYFEKLFFQLPSQLASDNSVYMILSQDCNIEKIKHIAADNRLVLTIVKERKLSGEWNYIFQIKPIN